MSVLQFYTLTEPKQPNTYQLDGCKILHPLVNGFFHHIIPWFTMLAGIFFKIPWFIHPMIFPSSHHPNPSSQSIINPMGPQQFPQVERGHAGPGRGHPRPHPRRERRQRRAGGGGWLGGGGVIFSGKLRKNVDGNDGIHPKNWEIIQERWILNDFFC